MMNLPPSKDISYLDDINDLVLGLRPIINLLIVTINMATVGLPTPLNIEPLSNPL